MCLCIRDWWRFDELSLCIHRLPFNNALERLCTQMVKIKALCALWVQILACFTYQKPAWYTYYVCAVFNGHTVYPIPRHFWTCFCKLVLGSLLILISNERNMDGRSGYCGLLPDLWSGGQTALGRIFYITCQHNLFINRTKNHSNTLEQCITVWLYINITSDANKCALQNGRVLPSVLIFLRVAFNVIIIMSIHINSQHFNVMFC